MWHSAASAETPSTTSWPELPGRSRPAGRCGRSWSTSRTTATWRFSNTRKPIFRSMCAWTSEPMDILFRRYAILIVAALLAAASGGAWAQAPQAAGRFVSVTGEVEVVGRDGARRNAERGGDIREGDTIVTGASALAQARMSDGGLISVRADSEFKLEQFGYKGKDDRNASFVVSILKGGFRTITGLIAQVNRGGYRISTPAATIGVRGTHFEVVHVLPQIASQQVPAGTYNRVFEGITTVQNPGGALLQVVREQTAFASLQGGAPTLVAPPAPIFGRPTPVPRASAPQIKGEDRGFKAAIKGEDRGFKAVDRGLKRGDTVIGDRPILREAVPTTPLETTTTLRTAPLLTPIETTTIQLAPTTTTISPTTTTILQSPTTTTTTIKLDSTTTTLSPSTTTLTSPTLSTTTTLTSPTTSTTTLTSPTLSTTTTISPTTTTTTSPLLSPTTTTTTTIKR